MTARSGRSPVLQHVRRLSGRRRARSEAGAFVLEGPHVVLDALRAGTELTVVVVEDDASGEARDAADGARAAGVTVEQVPAGSLAGVLDAATPQGVAAVAPFLDRSLDELAAEAVASDGFLLVLAAVGDPGNAGTLLRSAEAAGACGVVTTAGGVDLYHPKTVRASAGALFHVPVAVGGAPADVVGALRSRGVRTVGTAVRGATALDDADLDGPVALVLGNEAHGLAPEVAAALDASVSIPMAGRAESLNVAMAGTLLCFEAARRRRRVS